MNRSDGAPRDQAPRPSAVDRPPAALEQWALLAAIRLGEHTCAATVAGDIEARTGRTYDRLVIAGVLAGLLRAGHVQRAGPPDNRLGLTRCRSFYRVTVHGRRALRLALVATDAMRAGLPGLTASG